MTKKTRILFCGDSLRSSNLSGFSYVALSFLKRFNFKQFELGYCVLTGGDSTTEDLVRHLDSDYSIVPVYNSQITDPKKALDFTDHIKKFGPDIVITISDPWTCDAVAYTSVRSSYLWIHYLTVETPDYPQHVMAPSSVLPQVRKSLKDILALTDMVIPVTTLGVDWLTRMGLQSKLSSSIIYNGIDCSLEHKGPALKSQVFGGFFKNDDIVFMAAGKNSIRKKLELILESFSLMLTNRKIANKKYDHIKLYMHTNPNEITNGTDIASLCQSLDLNKYIFFSTELSSNLPFPRERLYARYKASDCYVMLPGGEGMALMTLEAMLHGKPVIYSDWGGHTTYLKDCVAYPVKIKEFHHANNIHMKFGLADIPEAAAIMDKFIDEYPSQDLLKAEKVNRNYVKNNMDLDTVIFPLFLKTVLDKYEEFKRTDIWHQFPISRVV